MPNRKHFVEFISPGTLVAETSTKPIESWDPVLAVGMAERIVERHGARPFGFRFHTDVVADPVPDGEGGELEVRPKRMKSSGVYFLGGVIERFDEVKARNLATERILRENMQCNGYAHVVTTTNVYRSTRPFGEEDFVVGPDGQVTCAGTDEAIAGYRKQQVEAWDMVRERRRAEWAAKG